MRPNPRLLIPVILVVLAFAGWFGWRALNPPAPERWLGYVEGETLYIAAPTAGTLAERPVERGAAVKAGAQLFTLNTVTTDAATAQLAAQAEAARAQAADLTQQRERPAELDVSRAAQAAARAQLAKTERDYTRYAALAARGFVSKSQLDAARAARDTAKAQLDQALAQQRSGELSAGRADQLRAAEANIASADAALRAQQRRRDEIAPTAPANGVIEQTFFNPGEWVPANAPVVAVLPDDKRKIRFFVPQDRVARLKVGGTIRFGCDGCGGIRTATIRYISPRSEFTPPVIYSDRAREKLVFLVEAALPASADPLPLGLPVDVEPVR
ncbi:HlyD family efflux transporter periplasmic adaptor subunit [Sphingomonas sp.]|uniref:HlyD family secretion protein n=1 Tax=Sphingomonas sp. TaxID=28214 RepID=UPI001B0875D0|nr:HlyD family efflux transporter periplasmic adaptor subunit [Sphingomonas sp.]MBO9713272.1 HlyD family efflux transporter periplasmic adaptor subunit [Sphingomonas sp.]